MREVENGIREMKKILSRFSHKKVLSALLRCLNSALFATQKPARMKKLIKYFKKVSPILQSSEKSEELSTTSEVSGIAISSTSKVIAMASTASKSPSILCRLSSCLSSLESRLNSSNIISPPSSEPIFFSFFWQQVPALLEANLLPLSRQESPGSCPLPLLIPLQMSIIPTPKKIISSKHKCIMKHSKNKKRQK